MCLEKNAHLPFSQVPTYIFYLICSIMIQIFTYVPKAYNFDLLIIKKGLNHQGNISHFSAQKLTVIIEIKVHTIQLLSTLRFDSMNDIFVILEDKINLRLRCVMLE